MFFVTFYIFFLFLFARGLWGVLIVFATLYAPDFSSSSGHHISAEVGAAVRLMLEKNTTLQSLLFLCPCVSGHCIGVEDRISIEFLLKRNSEVLLFFCICFIAMFCRIC